MSHDFIDNYLLNHLDLVKKLDKKTKDKIYMYLIGNKDYNDEEKKVFKKYFGDERISFDSLLYLCEKYRDDKTFNYLLNNPYNDINIADRLVANMKEDVRYLSMLDCLKDYYDKLNGNEISIYKDTFLLYDLINRYEKELFYEVEDHKPTLVNKEEVLDLTRKYLGSVSPRLLKDFNKMYGNGKIILFYENESDNLIYTYGNLGLVLASHDGIYVSSNNLLSVKLMGNANDVTTLVHEFIHVNNFRNNNGVCKDILLNEFPSIYFEKDCANYLKENGYDCDSDIHRIDFENEFDKLELPILLTHAYMYDKLDYDFFKNGIHSIRKNGIIKVLNSNLDRGSKEKMIDEKYYEDEKTYRMHELNRLTGTFLHGSAVNENARYMVGYTLEKVAECNLSNKDMLYISDNLFNLEFKDVVEMVEYKKTKKKRDSYGSL